MLLALLVAACEPAGTALPPDAVILPGNMAEMMVPDQCSSEWVDPGDGTWMPSARDIAALEAALPTALRAARMDDNRGWLKAPQGWLRQYVGILRGGRRMIYGNFLPSPAPTDQWRHEVVIDCVQDPSRFRAEYDVEAARFTNFVFNGSL